MHVCVSTYVYKSVGVQDFDGAILSCDIRMTVQNRTETMMSVPIVKPCVADLGVHHMRTHTHDHTHSLSLLHTHTYTHSS